MRPTPLPLRSYLPVLGSAVACYTALGAVLGIIPRYVDGSLHGGPVLVGLAVGAPAITGAGMRPYGGHLADRHGPRAVMLLGATGMSLGTLPALAPNLAVLFVSGLAVGAGEALMMSAAVLWLLRLAGPRRQALALGHIGLANYAGLTIGPLLSAPLGGAGHPLGVWLAATALPALAAAAVSRLPVPSATADGDRAPIDDADSVRVWRVTAGPGIGLLLVNIGYVAVLAFGAAAVERNGLDIGSVVLPAFAGGVIVSRTLLGWAPDRFGPGPTLVAAALAEGAGLAVFGTATTTWLAVLALVILSIGQGLAVPSLGALALAGVPAGRRGAVAGAFFAYFDAGVGLGGPLTGVLARAFAAPLALAASGAFVAAAIPVALLRRGVSRRPRSPRRRPAAEAAGSEPPPRAPHPAG